MIIFQNQSKRFQSHITHLIRDPFSSLSTLPAPSNLARTHPTSVVVIRISIIQRFKQEFRSKASTKYISNALRLVVLPTFPKIGFHKTNKCLATFLSFSFQYTIYSAEHFICLEISLPRCLTLSMITDWIHSGLHDDFEIRNFGSASPPFAINTCFCGTLSTCFLWSSSPRCLTHSSTKIRSMMNQHWLNLCLFVSMAV